MDTLIVFLIVAAQMVGTFALLVSAALLLISWFDRALGDSDISRRNPPR